MLMRARSVGLFIVAVGLLTLVGSCRAMNHAYSMRSSGRELVGRVVAAGPSEDGGTIEVQYQVKGEVYRIELDVDRKFLRSHPLRAKCDLIYLDEDPQGAILPSDPSLSGSTTILLFLGAIGLLVVGGVLAVLAPGAGNIFKRGGTPLGPSDGDGDGDDERDEDDSGDDEDDPSHDDPVFIMGRPI